MPTRPRVACTAPGCPNARPCPAHPASWGRAMPRGWGRTRARILARDGYRCRSCGAPANEVHHVRGRDEQDDAWLVSLCSPCHAAITRAQAAAGRGL